MLRLSRIIVGVVSETEIESCYHTAHRQDPKLAIWAEDIEMVSENGSLPWSGKRRVMSRAAEHTTVQVL